MILESRFSARAFVGFVGGVDWEGWGCGAAAATARMVGGYVGVCEAAGDVA